MGHRIEKAKSGRSVCTTCNAPIEKGDVRVAEEVNDISIAKLIHRFYHLRCAVATHPLLVRRALDSFVEAGALFDRDAIEAKIAPHVELEKAQLRARYEATLAEQRPRAAVIAPDDTTTELLEQLADEPDDAETLAVLADQLQARGDARGELITMQLAVTAGQRDSDLAHRRAELMHELAPPLDPGDRSTWGLGYLRRLELVNKTGARLGDTIALWDHGSLRLLSELHLTFRASHDANFVARLPELAPKSLRVLELESTGPLPHVAELLAVLPRLEALTLVGRVPLDTLAHPRIARLELGLHDPFAVVATLHATQLPAIVELVLRGDHHQARDLDEACDVLATTGWLGRLARLGLVHGHLGPTGIARLEAGLAGRRLARLDLTGTPVRLALRARLADLCDALVMPDVAPEPAGDGVVWVEHANKPEWGRGRLLRRYDGKVEVEFAEAGRKVFKADAAFLRFP